jgi:transposase-like protein
MHRHRSRLSTPRSSFAEFRFPPTVILVAVRWYLRYGLSYRDVEELLAERGITVDHVTIYRWAQDHQMTAGQHGLQHADARAGCWGRG